MPKKVRVGVIGAGGIGTSVHLPAYAALPDVEIVAVADIIEERAKKAAERFGAPHAFADYKELLKLDELDAVTVCTPNYMHAPITIDALKAGKHVLCEKPLAINPEQAAAMVDAAKAAGKILMVGVNNRFRDESQKLKRMIQAGELGEIYAARCGWVRRRGVPFWGDWFMEKAKSGGGPLIDIGVHMLDLTWWLMGKPKAVACSGAVYHKIGDYRLVEWDVSDPVLAGAMKSAAQDKIYDVEDSAFALIKFENGAVVSLIVSWALNTDKERNYCELYGDKAGAQLSPLTIYTEKGGSLADISVRTNAGVKSHWVEVEHFVDCVRNEKEPLAPGSDGLEIIKMLDAIYKSAETGREVRIQG